MGTTQAEPRPNGAEHQPQTQELPQQSQSGTPLIDQWLSRANSQEAEQIILRRAELDVNQRLAKMFSASGCFQDIDKAEDGAWLSEATSIARAMVKIELGKSMGFSPAESMTGIDIIKGRVAVGAALRGARMQRAGFSWPQMVVTDKGCWMPLVYKGEPMMCPKVDAEGNIVLNDDGNPKMVQVVVSFTEKDARMLGLLDKNQSMYKKDPSSMYFARTITRAQRRYGPGVLGVDVLDTYEAQEVPEKTPPPSINLDQFKPSTDPNRGHDAAMPSESANPESDASQEAAPVEHERPTASAEQAERQTSGRGNTKPEPKKKTPPKKLYDYADWERAQQSVDWGADFLKVQGVLYELVDGNYKKHEG